MFWEVLHSDTVRLKATLGQEVLEIFTVELGEAPLAGNKDLLTSRVLELGTSESLNDLLLVTVVGPHRHDGLTDLDTGNCALGFTKGTTHSGLQSISTSTR